MVNVDNYISGKVLKNVKLMLFSLKLVEIPIFGSYIKKELSKRIKKF